MKLEELEKLAKEATPGPWEDVQADDPRGQPVPYYPKIVALLEHNPDSHLSVISQRNIEDLQRECPANAAFIAAHNPERMQRIYQLLRECRDYIEGCEPCLAMVALLAKVDGEL